jgi:hypothetical protein
MGWTFDNVGRSLARWQKPAKHCEPFTTNGSMALRDTLRPNDVLLVEGKGRISGSIKYLTQSSWSHTALYVGSIAATATDREPHVLIEANIDEVSHRQRCRNICIVKLRKGLPLRVRTHWPRLRFQERHRPDALSIPTTGAQPGRRRAIALGSGDATRIVCSSLIAHDFLLAIKRGSSIPAVPTYSSTHCAPKGCLRPETDSCSPVWSDVGRIDCAKWSRPRQSASEGFATSGRVACFAIAEYREFYAPLNKRGVISNCLGIQRINRGFVNKRKSASKAHNSCKGTDCDGLLH